MDARSYGRGRAEKERAHVTAATRGMPADELRRHQQEAARVRNAHKDSIAARRAMAQQTPAAPTTQEHTMTTTHDDATDFLLGGEKIRSAKFETVNDTVKGTILDANVRQQTDISTGELLTWDDGKPKNQLVITLQTDLREPVAVGEDPDDGRRRVYVKGSTKNESKSMTVAVREALRAAGAGRLEIGATLAVRYTGDGVATTRGFTPPKQYTAKYEPPAKTDDFFSAPTAATPPAAAARAPLNDSEPPF